MTEEDIRKKFGVTAKQLDARATEYESDDWSNMKFGKVVQGRPKLYDEELKTITLKVPASRIAAIERIASEKGITRSEFVRQAIDDELLSAK